MPYMAKLVVELYVEAFVLERAEVDLQETTTSARKEASANGERAHC